jgi:hypothetical protein
MISLSKIAATFAICFAMLPSVPASAVDGAMGFSIDVSLSPQAAAKLAALKEQIVVSVLWYGEPTKAARKHADEMGQIDLGKEEARLPGSGGRAEITGRSVQLKQLDWVKDRAVQVNVNVFSARLSGPNNILNCDLFDDNVVVARSKSVQIACKLIEEQ